MGTIVEFPKKKISGSPSPTKPIRNAMPALQIADDPPGAPGDEFAHGLEEGTRVARYEIASRAEFLALVEAQRAGPASFFAQVQCCGFVQREPAAAAAPFGVFVRYMTGAQGGGTHGHYAQGFRTAFAMVEPFIRTLQ